MQLTTISCPHQPRGEDSQASEDITDLSRGAEDSVLGGCSQHLQVGLWEPSLSLSLFLLPLPGPHPLQEPPAGSGSLGAGLCPLQGG